MLGATQPDAPKVDSPITSVDPRGIGTAQCESLSGYVQRVSALHGSRPGSVLFRILAWIDQGHSQNIGRWFPRHGRLLMGNNINGFKQADSWLRALQCATRRSDLTHLTTRGWDTNFPTRGFLSSYLAWCPLCLATDPDPYHRLAWLIDPVRGCVIHRRPLQRRCARCKKELSVLHDRSLVCGCPCCGGDLRDSLSDASGAELTEFDVWSAHEIGRLITASVAWQKPLAWDPVAELKTLARNRHLSGPAEFARAVGTSKITAWYWLTGKARPSLPLALHVFHRLGESLATRLGCPAESASLALVGAQPEFHLRRVRHAREIDWDRIAQQMQAELAGPISDARPLLTLAKSLAIPVRSIRAHFPDACRAVAERYRARKRSQIHLRDATLRIQIQTAMATLASNELVLSKRCVEALLGRPGLFNCQYARRIYDEARINPQAPETFRGR